MQQLPSFTVVIPTIREDSIRAFLKRWRTEFAECRVIVIEDNPHRSFTLPKWVEHYAWDDIDSQLGSKAWIIPRRSDCVRSFGFYKAFGGPYDHVLTLDDDCYPEPTHERAFLERLTRSIQRSWPEDRWWNTLAGPI